MTAFTFDFDLQDDLDESFNVTPPPKPTLPPTLAPEGAELPAEEIPLSDLLSALPEALSYSPLSLPAGGPTLVRRDLFDVRFQLLEQGCDEQAALVDAPADLVPGVYEGGLKTWECALDLAAYVDRDVLGLRVLELGCGTAVPTLLLLNRLFASLASESGQTGPAVTEIHLQDYNRAVLQLVTFPNVLLAWYVSPLSAPYRASAPDADDEDDEDSDDNCGQARRPGGALTVTPALLAAFKTSLDAHNVRLRFFSGGWTSLRAQLAQSPPYDVVLASETIYRTDALGAFLGVLRAATMRVEAPRAPPLCLVAAKVLYFGVGGGVQEFMRAVEEEGGTVHMVWEHRAGVGRRIMRVEW